MAKLNVKPTRMELIRLKRRVKTAHRGHKLLRDKQDGLMKKFMEIIREARTMRKDMEKRLAKAFESFMYASANMYPEMLESALMFPEARVSLSVTKQNVMSVKIPNFHLEKAGEVVSYGFAQTSPELDKALQAFSDAFELLIKLSEIEKQAELLAEETEKTRRRVNALEYMLIPNLKETVKFISMKLSEGERAAIISVMQIKAKMEHEAG